MGLFRRNRKGPEIDPVIPERPPLHGKPRAVETFALEGPVTEKRRGRRKRALGGSKPGRSREPNKMQKKHMKEVKVPRKGPIPRSRTLISQADRRMGLQRIGMAEMADADARIAEMRTIGRAAKKLRSIGGVVGAGLGAAAVAERAMAAEPGKRAEEVKAGTKEILTGAAVGGTVGRAAARAAPMIARGLARVSPAGLAAVGAYDLGRLAYSVWGAFQAKRHKDKTRAHTKEKYGSVEAATRTRHARERARGER